MRKIIFILLFFSSYSYSQKVRNEIDTIVKLLVNDDSEYFDTDFEFKNAYKFNDLKEKATIKELLNLSKSKNKQIVALSILALMDLKYEKTNQLFKKYLNTQNKLRIAEGCLISDESFAYILYDRITNQHYYNELNTKDSIYFNSKAKDFNEIIISNKNYHSLLGYALQNNNCDISNYKEIRKLAFQHENKAAISTLATYKNKNDIPNFIQLKEKAFEAISVFNDESFWEFLISYKNKEKSENYINAIASYQNEKSNDLLTEIVRNKENDSIIAPIFKAISKHYSPIYLDLFKTIFQKKGYINVKVAQKLIEKNTKEASDIFTQKLLSKDLIFELYENYNGNELFEIYPLILSVIKENNNTELESICINRIKLLDSFSMQAFLEIAENEHFSNTSEFIFEKLENKNTAYDYYHLSKTIFSFENEKETKKVLEILKQNEKDWNWGNWSDSFKQLLNKLNLEL